MSHDGGMTYTDVITALVALLGVLISLVSLKRTREVNKRQLDMQEETTRLAKIQREILEREEGRRQDAERQLANEKRKADEQAIEAARLDAARRAQGNVDASPSTPFRSSDDHAKKHRRSSCTRSQSACRRA